MEEERVPPTVTAETTAAATTAVATSQQSCVDDKSVTTPDNSGKRKRKNCKSASGSAVVVPDNEPSDVVVEDEKSDSPSKEKGNLNVPVVSLGGEEEFMVVLPVAEAEKTEAEEDVGEPLTKVKVFPSFPDIDNAASIDTSDLLNSPLPAGYEAKDIIGGESQLTDTDTGEVLSIRASRAIVVEENNN